MTIEQSEFPGVVWNGLSDYTQRTSRDDTIRPNFQDWDKIVAETIAMQRWQNPPWWEDIRVAVNTVRVPPAQPPTWTAYKGTQILAFADQAVEGNEERVYFTVQFPHTYIEGTNIRPHVHWVGEDNTAGDVVWKLTYSWASMQGVFPTETAIIIASANSLTTDYHNYAALPEITGTGKEISSIMLCALKRNSSNAADTYSGKDAYLLEFDVHFLNNTLGSREELSKY